MRKKLLLRFGSLIEVGDSFCWSFSSSEEADSRYLEYNMWSINSANLIAKTCDESAATMFRGFRDGRSPDEHAHFEQLSMLKALKDDYEFGLFDSGRALIEGEIFDNQLEQSRELLRNKYKAASAVIAGVVLQTKLGELCEKNDIKPSHTMAAMNDGLKKKGAYDKLWHTKILGFIQIRNYAAHDSDKTKYQHKDVETMIEGIELFLMLDNN